MSTSLHVYAVSHTALREIRGSRNVGLLDDILTENAEYIAELDALTEENVAEELEGFPEFLSCRAALEHIVQGTGFNPGLGVVYAHAYERVCAQLASQIDGWPSISGSSGFFDRLDECLTAVGAEISFLDLVGRGPVFQIPLPVVFPALGYWLPEQLAPAAARLHSDALSALPDELQDDLANVHSWLEQALEQPGACLVGVQHY